MNKKILCFMLAGILSMSSVCVYADEKDDKIAELEAQIEDLQKQLQEALSKTQPSTDQEEYLIGETWIVEGLLKLTIDSVEETVERNEYSDKKPEAVYIVTYTYENLGAEDDLYISLDNSIIDSSGKMGYSYPGNITMYPQSVPVGARCEAQVCIGVDTPGNFKLRDSEYDKEYNEHEAIFYVEVE